MEEMEHRTSSDMLPQGAAAHEAARGCRCPRRSTSLTEEEATKLIDIGRACTRTRSTASSRPGIIFIDEIDKIAGARAAAATGPTSRARACSATSCRSSRARRCTTKYGMVKTDHILFIAAGAFHVSKPSDLIPELQGRFPIRVELEPLTEEDFVRILTEPENALTKQYTALLGDREA